MQKIRLDLETLSVESFDTTARPAEARGTVHAHRPPPTADMYCGESLEIDCGGSGASDCGTCASDCGTCATNCGTCGATQCGTCYDASCCPTYCGTCDPYCCCTCSCN